jgi:hypothetical protein
LRLKGNAEESSYRQQSPTIIPHRGERRGELYFPAQPSQFLVRIGGGENLETTPDRPCHTTLARLLRRAPQQVLIDFHAPKTRDVNPVYDPRDDIVADRLFLQPFSFLENLLVIAS